MTRKALSWRVRGLVMAQSYLRSDDCFICNWCCARLTHKQVVIDHVMPLALGGTDELSNLTVACADCNAMKGAREPQEAEEAINAVLAMKYGWEPMQ